MLAPEIDAKLRTLPTGPGVYVFKDQAGKHLYVGKAAHLRSRVRSYFQRGTSDSRFFLDGLAHELGDVETFVTKNEKEAALLENSLIKEYLPRYNVKLRDDKDFLSLRLDPHATWPRLEVARRPTRDRARYFGPYHSATAARSTLRLVNRHFQLRTCTDTELRSRTRACLQYQIKRCPAPCVHDVDPEQYAHQVRNVGLFLEGRHDELLAELYASMENASNEQRYEMAAVYRDQVRAVESARQTQRVSLVSSIDQDVFGLFRLGDKAEVAVLMVRRGRVTGVRTFALRELRLPDDEIVASFVGEYYRRGSFVPHEVVLPVRIEAARGLQEVLSEQRGAGVRLLRPQRGHKAALLRMASENATHAFREKARASEDMDERLDVIRECLGLRARPERIECIDISHHGGGDTVAVMVAFAQGEPDRARYKSFRVRDVTAGDDYAAIAEVLRRRLRRRGEDGWSLPDLLVIDGGKGQLGIAQRALRELQVEGLEVVALAKERLNALDETLVDRVYVPGRKNAVPVGDARDPLRILGLARDEAHRASNALRVKVGSRRRLRSGLHDVAGVGPRTAAKLLRGLGSLQAVRGADEAALLAAGATRRQARAILKHFAGESTVAEPRASEAHEAPVPEEQAVEEQAVEEQAVDNAFLD